jgi:hypothetical protein
LGLLTVHSHNCHVLLCWLTSEVEHIGPKVPVADDHLSRLRKKTEISIIIYINSVSLSVSDGGFGGGEGEVGATTGVSQWRGFLGWGRRGRWSNERPVSVSDGVFGVGRERPVKQWATGVSLWRGWTTTVSAPVRCRNQDLISTKHRSRPKGKNDGRIASLSHHTRGGYKNLPLPPPTTERTGGYIEECVFRNFQNFQEPKFKMSEPGFWVFSPPSGKGVNTWTDNLRVHTASSDTRIMSVGTTALSHNIVFICGDINAFRWDPRVLFWENFRLWRLNRAFGVAGVA